MKNKTTLVFWAIVTIIPILGILFSLTDPQSFSETQEFWSERIVTYGFIAPIAFILLQAFQVVVTPISHYSIGVLGGFLYGPFLGAFYNWLGKMIGHTTAFFIARIFGRKLAERFVSEKTLSLYDKHVSDKSLILFLIYFLPVFPDDEISYLAGLSKMRFSVFFITNIFGHIGGSLGLAYVGSGIDSNDTTFWVLTLFTLFGFLLFWFLVRKARRQEVKEVSSD
jgi:uncharacterized membrane protein YdjX (TVP38/TMEM64 family)